MSAERLNTFNDQSGLVTVAVFRHVAVDAQDLFTDQAADVSPDMVIVGGGGVASLGPPGQLLTASYPKVSDRLDTWLVSSKAHEESSPCRLETYAVGLAIKGMSRDDLIGNLRYDQVASEFGDFPEASAGVPEGFLLISGGFRVDFGGGAGSLGTASFPANDRVWTARSKAHDISSPASIVAFAISIRENLPVGRVEVSPGRPQSSGESDAPAGTAPVEPGFALTGGGAEVHVHPQLGSLLWKLQPTTDTGSQFFSAASKAHRHHDPSTIDTYALGIRILR